MNDSICISKNILPASTSIRAHSLVGLNRKELPEEKSRAYKSFLRSSKLDKKPEGIKKMINKGSKMIENAIRNHFFKVGNIFKA